MHATIKRLFLCAGVLLAVTLSACGGGGGSNAASTEPPPPTGGQVISANVNATQNGNAYPIQIFLPASYADGTAKLPVIYATEGDAPYGAGGRQSRFDAFKDEMQSRGTQAILVGIGGTARRNVDFLLPGAEPYLNFIAKDLAPSIERQYRADPKKRALSGLSHGGYFVVAALILEGKTGNLSFSHYLSTESSFGAQGGPAALLDFEKQLQTSGKAVPATLFLAGARSSNGPVIVDPLYAQMAAQSLPGLTLLNASYDTTHVGADLPAFREALTRFIP